MLVPLIFVMLIQAVLFFGTFWFGGSIERLNNNAFDILNERVINRKNYIENYMVQRWSNVKGAFESVNNKVSSVLNKYGEDIDSIGNNSEMSIEIISRVSDNVVDLLRKNSVTGAFVILNGGDNSDLNRNNEVERYGIYLRDLDPNQNPDDTSDIMVERAPSKVTKEMNVQMDSWWTHNFSFKPNLPYNNYDFYYKPLQAAFDYPDISYSDLGYWSHPFRLEENDIEIITYSVPLIYNDGTPYGVLGIEISIDYLRKLMPYDEISLDKNGSYMLAVDDEMDLNFDNIVGSGSSYKYFVGDDSSIVFEKNMVYNNSYKMDNRINDRVENSVFGCIQYFNLYNSNTPFENERWALIGMVEERNLLGFTKSVKSSIILSLVISLIIGVIGVGIISIVFTRPIILLVKKVKSSNPKLPVKFDKIDIFEIDELSSAIENLSFNVYDTASRLSQVIEMSSIPVAAFEYNKATNEIYHTESFFELLCIPTKTDMTVNDFEKIMLNLEKNIEEKSDEDNIAVYRIVNNSGENCWVRINKVENSVKVLGVIIDITKETIEKKKIEHDRDYDLLTNLLNRRAFHNIMEKMFQKPKDLGICAVLMMDLDNLKYINDTYGHDYGDEYIKCAAKILDSYSNYRCIAARMSGDEFYVFIYGYKDKEGIRAIVNDLKNEIRNSKVHLPDRKVFKIRASAGLSWYPDDSESYEQLIKYADFSMYKVKNTVKGEFQEFDIQVYSRDSYLLHSKEEFNKIIDDGMVTYHFQPIVDTANGEVFAYEALMRSGSEILKSPLEILTMAKSQSKLYHIEKLTWFKALYTFSQHKNIEKSCRIFINSIPNQILSNEDISLLEEKYGDYLSRIVLELTEDEKLNDDFTDKKQVYMKRWDGKFALDDYGTGYNGEAMLLSRTPDFIKIDISIVRNIDKDENRQRLFQNITSYSKKLGIKIIAEGVETQEELNVLIANGADYLQGFYLGRPMLIPESISEEIKDEIKAAHLL